MRLAMPLAVLVALTAGGISQPSAQATVTPLAYLRASNAEPADHFGCGGVVQGHTGQGVALSADGGTIAIGAPHEGGAGNTAFDSGAVYVFARSGTRWTEQAVLRASNPQMSAQFGHAVTLSADGNTLAVSAMWESSAARGVNGNQQDESIPQAGAVYVFTRTGGRWTQHAYLKASNTGEAGTADTFGEGDQFGFSVALNADGTTLAVGSLTEDGGDRSINGNQADNSAQGAGAVYVFTRSGAAWTQQAYLKPSNIDAGDFFGIAVALNAAGNTLAVGSFDEDGSTRAVNGPHDNKSFGSGAAYVFTRSGASWSQQAYIKPSNGEPQDSFGVHLALSDAGDTLLVGSLDEDCAATGIDARTCGADWTNDLSMGAAYVFARTGTTWSQQAFLKASNTGVNDWFGARVALSGDGTVAAVGAPFEDAAGTGTTARQDDNSATEAGAVYLFVRSGGTWRQHAYVKGSNTEAFDQFGSSVALDRTGGMLVASAWGEDSAARTPNGNQNDNSAGETGAAYVMQVTK
jgi:trimeric autotransporter adhesin